MGKYGARSILPASVLVPAMACCSCASFRRKGEQISFEAFLFAPSRKSRWAFEADVRSRCYSGPQERLSLQLLKYFDATGNRDFPNSMALAGIIRDQFVDLQIKRVNSAVDSIRKHQSDDL